MHLIQIKQLTVGLNQKNFDEIFGSELSILDSRGHPMSYETVLVEDMTGKVLEEYPYIYRASFDFYPFPIFVLKEHTQRTTQFNQFEKLSSESIKKRLLACLGKAYLWGGNDLRTTDFFWKRYVKCNRSIRDERAIRLDGLDCSGLLFYATNFNTPRNTSQLQSIGIPILDYAHIKPLDLIMTKGHVQIVLDEKHVVQSRQNRGVYISKLQDELKRLVNKKNFRSEVKNIEDFSIRRFY